MRSQIIRTARAGLRSTSHWQAPRCLYHHHSRHFSSTPTRREEEGRKWSTPLAKQLADAISITGPIPLASYMRMCLTADVGGYYTGAIGTGRDQFGQKGDFVTSPEISQVFGELIGIWLVAEWMSQGRPRSGVELIEVGPGRGTLMDDILRTIRNFKDMASAIDAVYLVEASSQLRAAQKTLLCGEDAAMRESKEGWHSTCKYSDLPIVWSDSIKAVPQSPSKTPFIVAHEFFDALPIHAFQVVEVPPATTTPSSGSSSSPQSSSSLSSTRQWREMVVSPTPEGTTHADLRTPRTQQHEAVPEFQLALSPAPTRHSRYLPDASARYRALLRPSTPTPGAPGSLIEVCPDAWLYASDFAARIGGTPAAPKAKPSGAALILDYGPADTVPANSLRGIRRHARVSPFADPGRVDLSADVDFLALVEAATAASPGVECHGPVDQAGFLEAMGIAERADMLVGANKKEGKEKEAEIRAAWRRLVDRGPAGMGKVYKALAILPENGGRRRPVGFGGDVNA
ncbi:S-adenosyl-L-methionine-dependent methyltransferase [Nemania sp. FL0916]|nr:S-adenosyl-L-methionine-dependent methyltransferase [Nemania sp. FL0916]